MWSSVVKSKREVVIIKEVKEKKVKIRREYGNGENIFDILYGDELNEYFRGWKNNLELTGILECDKIELLEYIKERYDMKRLEEEYAEEEEEIESEE